MHPFVQAIIAVFVGLVVLGPAKVEIPPDALSTAPIAEPVNFAQPSAPDPIPTLTKITRVAHGPYANLDRPDFPSIQALQLLARQDQIAVGRAPFPLQFAITNNASLTGATPTPQPKTVAAAPAPDQRDAQSNRGNLATTSQPIKAQIAPASTPSWMKPETAILRHPKFHAPVTWHNHPTLTRTASLFAIPRTRQQLITELAEPPSPYTPLLINADFVHLRTAPNANAEIVTQLSLGDWVLFAGVTQGNWSQVLSSDGEEVWVYSPYLSQPDVEAD